jgi:hypothetical protein
MAGCYQNRSAAACPVAPGELFGPESLAATAPSNGGKRAASGLGPVQIRSEDEQNPS